MRTKSTGNGCLVFRFKDLIDETNALGSLAAAFLTEDSKVLLKDFAGNINAFASSRATTGTLEITRERPLMTTSSDGYKPDTGGGLGLVGKVSGVWEIEKVPDQKNGKKGRFRTIGLSSWLVSLCDGSEKDVVAAEWCFDLGTRTAPGCFFHVQVTPTKTLSNGKPSDLDVPRLPSILITPMDALAFLLGELFQDQWPITAVDSDRQDVRTFRQQQLDRFRRLFEWYGAAFEQGGGIPWAELKSALPNDYEMFTR